MALNTITEIIKHELTKQEITSGTDVINNKPMFDTYYHKDQNTSKRANVWYSNYTNTINIRYYTYYYIYHPTHHHTPRSDITDTHNPQDPDFNIQQIIQKITTWLTTPSI